MKESKLPFINPSLNITGELLIVGSSNSLLNNYGGLINSFQTVFRFNRAPLIGYEEHVGSKTNFRILSVIFLWKGALLRDDARASRGGSGPMEDV